jgi:molybdenum cofactor cytidylyltransferase
VPEPPVVLDALVLAAGSSTRMGANKLLEREGETLVRRAVRAAEDSGVGRVVVVLGHDEPRMRAALEGAACTIVVNPDHARGMGTSLRTGVRHVSAEAVIIVLADMPLVTAAMIAGVAERYRVTRAPVVVSQYGDVQPNTPLVAAVHAPPTLFARALFPELLSIGDAEGAKDVARRHLHEAEVVNWPRAASRDVDRPADYDAVRARRAGE